MIHHMCYCIPCYFKQMKVYIAKKEDYTSKLFLCEAYYIAFGAKFSEEEVITNVYGKPYFEDSSRPSFSISHSGKWIGCVFDEFDVGFDIQRIKRIPRVIMQKYLLIDSSNMIDSIIEWTKFESYGKMKGTGIPPEDDYRNGFFLTSVDLPGYIITICTEKKTNQDIELVFI